MAMLKLYGIIDFLAAVDPKVDWEEGDIAEVVYSIYVQTGCYG